jgi:hypothetical protein
LICISIKAAAFEAIAATGLRETEGERVLWLEAAVIEGGDPPIELRPLRAGVLDQQNHPRAQSYPVLLVHQSDKEFGPSAPAGCQKARAGQWMRGIVSLAAWGRPLLPS